MRALKIQQRNVTSVCSFSETAFSRCLKLKYMIRFSMLSIGLALTFACKSQEEPIDTVATPMNKLVYPNFFGILDSADLTTKYPFIQFQHNNYNFQTETAPNFEKLYQDLKKMTTQKDRKINFYHIGGSHIQADIYSHQMRTMLQQYWTDLPGERGMVFPYDLLKTNTPGDFLFRSKNSWVGHKSTVDTITEYGLLGMVAETKDSVIDLHFEYERTKVKPGFDKIRVYHQKGQFAYKVTFGADSSFVVNQHLDTILGYTETFFSKELESFDMRIVRNTGADTAKFKTYGFLLSNKKPGITYNSIGVNGASLPTYIRNAWFEEQLREFPPDFFAFSIGTNDANVPIGTFNGKRYYRNLDSLVQRVLTVNPNCALLFTMPNDAYYQKTRLNRNLPFMRDEIFKLAKKYNAPVWDFYGMMGELGSSKVWAKNKLMRNDLIHFTMAGYTMKGEMFFEAFMKWYQQMQLREEKLKQALNK
jgi:lysophospholipase L1-like esterase